MSDQMRELAQTIADEQISSTEFLTISETAWDMDLDLSGDDMRQVYDLVLRAKAVLPDAR